MSSHEGGRSARVAGITSTWVAVDDAVRPLADASPEIVEPAHPWRELVGARTTGAALPPSEPPAMLGLTLRSAAAGAGFRHWSPDGALLLRLIEQWMRSVVAEQFGGMEIVTPMLYRWQPGQAVHELAETFADRVFRTSGDAPERMLRYSADPGVLDYLSAQELRPDDLPVRLWEYGTFFRRNRDGELRGIQRLHEFRLLDHHTVIRLSEAGPEYERLLAAQVATMRALAGPVAVEFTVTADQFDHFVPLFRRTASLCGVPALVEIISRDKHYWRLKSFVHVAGPYETSNLQLDVENATRFGFGDAGLGIIHCTMCTAERVLLVAAEAATRRTHPALPLWLSPVQVRVLPARADTTAGTATLDTLRSAGVRAELDDRPHSLGWRIRDAAQTWIPYVLVVGDRDDEAEAVEVRNREGQRIRMAPSQLIRLVLDGVSGFPQTPLPRRSTRERFWIR